MGLLARAGLADSAPAVAKGVVYLGTWDNNCYALRADTGASVVALHNLGHT